MAALQAATEIKGVLEAKRIGQAETHDSNVNRLNSLMEGDTVTARIRRFDPSKDDRPRYETYEVPYVKWMRVLDVLNYVAEDMETPLAHRWFCGVKKCGICAVRVNGREVLACWEAAEPEMVIEPLLHLPIVRDLVVNREPYEKLVLRMAPWLVRGEPYPGFPEYVTDHEMAKASLAMDCISCMACYSACPVLDLGEETKFSGPAPLVQLAQTALDPRDAMDRARIVLEEASIFSCVSCYKCEEVCPVGIPIVSHVIEPLKAIAYRAMPRSAHHQVVFVDIVAQRGRIDPSALVLRTQGFGALRRTGRILKLLVRGKIDPVKTFFGSAIPAMNQVRRLYAAMKGSKS